MLLAFGLCFLELNHRWLTWQKVETSMPQVDDLTEIVNQNAKNAEEATRTRVYGNKNNSGCFALGDIQWGKANAVRQLGRFAKKPRPFQQYDG